MSAEGTNIEEGSAPLGPSKVEQGEGAPDSPGPLKVWLMASRPRTLTAALSPILVGSALAALHDGFHAAAAICALITAMLLQIGTNLANDLFDFKKGADNADRLGPRRVTQAGLVSPRQIAWATVIAFGLSFVCGLYLVSLAGWPLLVLGLVSIASGVAYTAGPFPLAYNGLGDVFVFIFFGLVATAGSYYVQTLTLDPLAIWLALPVAFMATAILIVNNTRDIDSDRKNRKITTAVLLGPKRARLFYDLTLLLAYLSLPAAVWLAGAPAGVLLGLLSAPLAVKIGRDLHKQDGPALNPLLGKTAMLQLITGALVALGVLL